MKELSLNILDIAMNSVKAEATRIDIEIRETEDELEFSVSDNGYGMSEEMIRRVTDPFCTTRTTRKVGLGIPFLRTAQAEQTGGSISITSRERSKYPNDCGTKTSCKIFQKAHRLYPARGYYINGVYAHPGLARRSTLLFTHTARAPRYRLSTRRNARACLARMSRCPRQRSLRGQPIICASNTTPCLHKFANRKRNAYRKGHQE